MSRRRLDHIKRNPERKVKPLVWKIAEIRLLGADLRISEHLTGTIQGKCTR